MPERTDPTFYRSPAEAIAAPPELLAYVAAFDPAGRAKDAMAVVDCDPASSEYGRVVGWSELPTAGNELHHFGWNACSSALCHHDHGDHGGHSGPLERRYLIVPGIRSSRTTKPFISKLTVWLGSGRVRACAITTAASWITRPLSNCGSARSARSNTAPIPRTSPRRWG